MSRGIQMAAALAALTIVAALLPASAPAAGRSIQTGFADPEFLQGNGHTRSLLLNRSVRVGSDYARIVIGDAFVALDSALVEKVASVIEDGSRHDDLGQRSIDRALVVLWDAHPK